MNLRALCALAALLATCFATALPAHAGEMQPPRPKPLAADSGEARVIVQFKPGAGTVRAHALSAHANREAVAAALQRRADALAARRGIPLIAGRGISERMQSVRATGIDSVTLARLLAADPDVENAWVNHRRRRTAVPNDPLFTPSVGTTPVSGQWYLKAPSNATPASINAVNAWDLSVGSTSMVVAVLDTGVRFDHDDLAGKLLPGYDMVSATTISNDGNGRDSDASDPGDYITASEAESATFQGKCEESPSSWHGTSVAGIIGAAANNGVGMAGVGWNVKVLPVRVLGKCFGYDDDIIAGMRWAAGLNVPGAPLNPTRARVINLSLGDQSACDGYASAVNEVLAQGTVVVAAAGNAYGLATDAPANCLGVIAVAAVSHKGTKTDYSSLGTEVSISAPGGNCPDSGACPYPILTTTNLGPALPVPGTSGSIYTDSFNPSIGTSFATPLVAGTAALMLSANPALTPAEVRTLLRSSARPFPTTGAARDTPVCQAPSATEQGECYCTASTCGAGMLDAAAAVQAAVNALSNPMPSSLQAAITATPQAPKAGQSVVLSAEQSTVGAGRTIVSYAWSVVAGSNFAFLVGPTNGSSATLSTWLGGNVTVRLTVADDAGNTSTVDQPIAIAALTPLQAVIGATPASPVAGQTVQLDGSGSTVDSTRSIASYQWTLVSGANVASFVGATNTSTATLNAAAAGTVSVRLTVTDNLGNTAMADRQITVAAVGGTNGGGTEAGGGGGGGAMSWAWLLALAGAVALLARPPAARGRNGRG